VPNPGLEVFIAFGNEAVRAIERHGMHLRRKGDLGVPFFRGCFDQFVENRGADAAAAPRLEHRHAPDMAIGQQPARGHRFSLHKHYCVKRERIVLVELDLARHALLFHEHGEADRRGMRARLRPGHELDSQHGAKSIIAA
jgi:hypothetical protein